MDELHLNKYGNYKNDNYVAIPFQHHKEKYVWAVCIIKNNPAFKDIYKQEYVKVCADSPLEAAQRGIIALEEFERDQRICKAIEAERKKQGFKEEEEEEIIVGKK